MLGRIRLDSQIIGQTFEGKKLYGVTHEFTHEMHIQRVKVFALRRDLIFWGRGNWRHR